MAETRLREYIFPKKVIAVGGQVENPDFLLTETENQIGLNESRTAVFKGKSYIILDFGREYQGSLRISTYITKSTNTDIRIRLGESVCETCAEPGESGTCSDYALRDITTKLVTFTDAEFCQSGFRFARIDFLDELNETSIKSICAVYSHRGLKPSGSFECSDEKLNRIFDVASHTVYQCMQTYLWDGIKRDRLVWIGDIFPEMIAIRALYGFDDCIEKSLDFCKSQAPLPLYMNGFPTYSVWWLIILNEYYNQNQNYSYLESQKDYITELITQLNTLVNEDGTTRLPFYFLDWPTHDQEDETAGVHALMIWGMQHASQLLRHLGLDASLAENVLNKLRKKKYGVKRYKQVKAMQVLSGEIEAAAAHGFLTEGGAKGLSTFMSYFILKAIALSGDTDSALQILKSYYGGMLERGATTFWEDFNIEWLEGSNHLADMPDPNIKSIHGGFGEFCYVGFRHSLCHGWSSGPVAFLTEFVLGINIKEPGCLKIEIKPNLDGLTYAKGTYPTPYGKISVSHRKSKDGRIITKVKAPKEIEITLA